MPADLGDRDAVRGLSGASTSSIVPSTSSSTTPARSTGRRRRSIDLEPGTTCSRSTSPRRSSSPRRSAPEWPRAASGKIIFTASLLSFQGGINVVGYTAAKHAIAGLTKALANEWAHAGVNVNAIAPGYIATDNTRPLRDDPDRARAILDRIPAGRWGRPEDIAGAAVFLASRPPTTSTARSCRRWRMAGPMSALDLIARVRRRARRRDRRLRSGAGARRRPDRAAGCRSRRSRSVPRRRSGRSSCSPRPAAHRRRRHRRSTPADVDRAVGAGAQFIVSPGFDAEVVRRCRELGVAR